MSSTWFYALSLLPTGYNHGVIIPLNMVNESDSPQALRMRYPACPVG